MRAYITGISGFVGNALARLLLQNGWVVNGIDLRKSSIIPNINIGDLHDKVMLAESISNFSPDHIFHLAGVIKTPVPQDYYKENVLGTLSLFECLLEVNIKPRVMIASSSAVYGSRPGNRPIRENFSLQPLTDYAASKIAQEVVAKRNFLAHDFPVITVRNFNLIGPGQPPDLACSSFARQIALAEKDPFKRTINTGNLNAFRDFLDIRDAVRAYELITLNGKPGWTYNVCSGEAVSLQTCVDKLLMMAKKPLLIEIDKNKIQKHDASFQIGNIDRLKKTIDWHPNIPLEQSLMDLLDEWRAR